MNSNLISHADPKIGLIRRMWRWWQIPIAGLIFGELKDKNDLGVEPSSMASLKGVIYLTYGAFLLISFFIYCKIGKAIFKTNINPDSINLDWLERKSEKNGWDNIPLRTIDKYRFWKWRAYGLNKEHADYAAILAQAEEYKKELLTIKLAGI